MQSNIPNYADLFGNLDFKEGDDARSVYSPAAYLSDLLQMLDDEFDPSSIDFDARRGDIKNINLDAENTNTLIPYLDIVNEVLEKRVDSSNGAYTVLKNAVYPFNMPFSLENEQIKNYLHHLTISAHELRHLFAKEPDYHTVAREYLGLSVTELESLIETGTETATEDEVARFYGYPDNRRFISEISSVTTFMEVAGLQAHEMRELLYQKLYVEPTNHSIVEDGRENFYINTVNPDNVGYVTLSDDETALVWHNNGNTSDRIPLIWFARTSRFVRLAKKIGLSLTELDHILRHCCKVNGTPTIDRDTLVFITQVIYIHKTLEQPIDTVVAVLSEISFVGKTNEKLPQDQFNQIFNLPCVSVNEKYLHIEQVMGDIPKQYTNSTYHTYTQIDYHADLFSKDNDIYRQRLRHSLGFTDTDLINITSRLELEEVADSSLWKKTENQWQLLNVLYRIRILSEMLNVHFLELFTLFDLLDQDPFIGQRDPHTYFVYRVPGTQKCFSIFMASVNRASTTLATHNIGDQLWLLESLIALTQWMKEFGYSAEMLWKIVNGAPKTDREAVEQKTQDLALYNALLQSFKAKEIRPDTLKDVLGDERASHFAFSLIKDRCGAKSEIQSSHHQNYPFKELKHLLLAYDSREIDELTEDFIQQLTTIRDYEFVSLQLESKLKDKIFNHLVNHQVIDGSGRLLTESLVDRRLPPLSAFMLEYDFSDLQQSVFELFHRIYQEDAASQLEANDTIEVQVFKSDLKELGLTEAECRELYDDLIYNGYIDEQGFAKDVTLFSDITNASRFTLITGLSELVRPVYQLLQQQLDKFEDSQVKISEQMFAELKLTPIALQDLIRNLQMNRYLDEHLFIQDKMRLVDESPKAMSLALQFYPYREALFKILKDAIAADQDTWLQIDQTELGRIAATTVSRWIFEDLQGNYLNHQLLLPQASLFFQDEANRDRFHLRPYFESTKAAIVFDHIAGIVNYANAYRLQDTNLTALDFDDSEIRGLKQNLEAIGVLDDSGLLRADQISFFLVPENAAVFNIPAFSDYDTEIFFQLYDIAKAIDSTVKAVHQALKEYSDAQQDAVLEQLQTVLGIDLDAIKVVSSAIFKTDTNLHFAWLQPLLENANALGSLDELPANMHYLQAVKRIRQLALLINQQQLDVNEVSLFLKDQDLVAKFPEDLILPDGITSIGAVLISEEFIYIFKENNYWIYLAEDYTLIDKKTVTAGQKGDDLLIEQQREDKERQKRLKEDPIRQLFKHQRLNRVDAAFIDRYGTWVVVSGESHYVKYANADTWDKRENRFGQVDNDFDTLEMIDAAYVDAAERLFLFVNDQYVRYSNVNFILNPESQENAVQPTVDQGYPKLITEEWNNENLPIQLPSSFDRDLGPMFDGLDGRSYAFLENRYVSSQDGRVQSVTEMWGHSKYDFGHADHIDAALASQGHYLFFLNDKVVKYAGSIELANLQPEAGYPKSLHQEFPTLPDEFVSGIDATLHGQDDRIYLFRSDDYVALDSTTKIPITGDARIKWGKVLNGIADNGRVDAAFVGLDGYTYLFSGDHYVRYSGSDYTQVDDGFPRNIAQDWEGLTRVNGAVVLGNKTYLFGTNRENESIYTSYSTLRRDEDDYLKVDAVDSNARTIETVLANRPDVDEIEVFPATVNNAFWSLPESFIGGAADFRIDAIMNGPNGRIYLFAGNYYIEHNHASRWWSEPKILAEQFDRSLVGINEGDHITAGFTGTDGKTYLFYNSKYLRFSDPNLHRLDNGYPRLTNKFWGKIRNNIDRTGKVDAAFVVESRWEEQAANGQLVDRTAMHTYLFSGDQMFRYEGSNYSTVEPGYPRSTRRLSQEPRFRGMSATFPDGLDAAFADRRQVYLFKGDSFHVVISDEDNDKHYTDHNFANIQAVTQERGVNYALSSGSWQKLNHLDDPVLTLTPATPRAAQKAEGKLDAAISAIVRGSDGKSYIFAGDKYYDVDLGRSFAIADVWGRSRNPIYDNETIDAAFVGRDGITYVFSGEWFVQYRSGNYVQQTVIYPPQRISDKWQGLRHVALAYVWEEDTYLFERPDANGNFRYLHYTEDTYDRPEPGYPQKGDYGLWNIPEAYQQQSFDSIDAIFVQDDTLIFISDQRFISFNLNTRTWGYPQPLALLYSGVPFNRTDFKELKSGFIGANGTIYLFSQHCYVSYDSSTNTWTNVTSIKGNWGLQTNVLSQGVDAAWVSSDGVTYLFARDSYVRYSSRDYSYVDEGYPKAIATYLRQEAAFGFMSREFQSYLDTLEAEYTQADQPFAFFNGLLDNGRCLYFFTRNTLFTGSPNKYVLYDIDGLGHIDNNFTAGGYVDAAFVDAENKQTYLFSGEQYIRYTGDHYRYIDEGYPKIIAESLAAELGLARLNEIYRDGIDAAFYLSNLGLVLFNERRYINVTTADDRTQSSSEGDINQVWGNLDNTFAASDTKAIDGAYVDRDGALYVFKEQQFVRYSDTTALFALNPYNEACYVDGEYPRYIKEIWPQLDATILKAEGVDAVFQFEDEIYFHTGVNFVTYNLDLSDHDEHKPGQVLSYRWGEWSDYLLSDVRAISRFKALGQRFTGGELTLTELVSSAKGTISEPYMHFAAIFGFEKREVRWVKQRNAFLPASVNDVEEDFQLELVLRLYDILATTCRLHVDVSALYHRVWLPLYGSNPDVEAAAKGAYDVLVAINCDNNYATLVNQIVNELNVLKRDALVSYVIAKDPDISTTRQLYQKLLIDIQMSSAAETSRIEEAIGAVQLYLHRYFINLEDIALDAADQQAARLILKDRWQWLRNYRVWEANRRVFLYPENYIRPELRNPKTAAFQALQDSLAQGELTEATVEDAYLKYLDSFTEVSELTIAGGYVYDDNSSGTDDKKLVLFGRTRTAPMRYFYRFGTFVNGDSTVAVWEPWEELDISIKATRVEPVFAFNRVFVFWTALDETAKDPSAGSVVVKDVPDSGGKKEVSSSVEIVREIKVYFSFYNLNKRWTQPQTLKTTFNDIAELTFPNQFISDVELFVENSTKLKQAATNYTYENIHITVRFYLSETATQEGRKLNYRAFNLMPELYSQKATQQTIDNRGQIMFKELFPNEFVAPKKIEDANIVKLNYSDNSMDGPWFAYNHKGCGFLVKPDASALSSNTQLARPKNLPGLRTMPGAHITAAVQVEQDIYYFLDNQTYIKTSADRTTTPTAEPIRNRWGIDAPSEMEIGGIVDSAFVINGCSYLTLNEQIYEYDGASFDSLVRKPYALSILISNLPSNWSKIDAGFTNINGVHFWFNNDLGEVLRSDFGTSQGSIRHSFGHSRGDALGSAILGAVVFNRELHVIHRDPITNDDLYTVYTTIGDNIQSTQKEHTTVKMVLESLFGSSVDNVERQGNKLTNMMVIDGGIWVVNASGDRYYVKDGNSQDSAPGPFEGNQDDQNWTSGFSYSDANHTVYYLAFYSEYGRISNNGKSFARAWRRTGTSSNYQYESVDFGGNSGLDRVLGQSNDRIVRGELDEEYGFDVSTLYNTDVTITGAFTTANSNYLIIITDTNTFHLFDNTQRLPEILAQLKDSSESRDIFDLRASVCLGTAPVNAIWRYNRVDTAFIGANNLGVTNALYLFCGNQYLRFTPTADGEFSGTADTGYPKQLSTNNEGFPQWTQLDAAFTSPDPTAESQYISYLFNNSTCAYYRSDTAATGTTVGVWGVFLTNLEKTQKVNAAYLSGGNLYLLVDTEVGGKKGTEYYRYTLQSSAGNNDPIPRYIHNDYPRASVNFDNFINAAFVLNKHVYLFSGTEYFRLGENVHEPTELSKKSSIAGSWGNIPSDIRRFGPDAAFQHTDASGKKTLYLIQGDRSISYNMSDANEPKPYEFDSVKYEIIRLTSSTAEVLNQLLFVGGIKNLLQMSTQEMDEVPTISFNDPKPRNIQLNSDKFDTEPTNNHLDFNSANGMYYWEVFFHAPFLIAQTLNTNQQFEYAKQWYEYIFDPTETSDYWKFLPFLAADPNALISTLSNDLDAFDALTRTKNTDGDEHSHSTVIAARGALSSLAAKLVFYQEVFLGKTDITFYETYDLKLKTVANINALEPNGKGLVIVAKIGDSYHVRIFDKLEQRVVDRSVDFSNNETLTRELREAFNTQTLTATKKATLIHDITSAIEFSYKLADITRWSAFITLESAIDNLNTSAATISSNNPLLVRWQSEMQEVLEIIKQLDYRIDLMGNYDAQLAVYLEDPFDPHAIAALRPLAYRKAIVMSYIDNLLDWGDILFRQYTRESIQEARMLYILAHDLLGEKPKNMGQVVLSPTKAYKDFKHYTGNTGNVKEDYDFLIDLENSSTSSSIVPYEQSLSFAATQFDTITNPYFFIKENELFTEYWTRVEDRLAKIRACLNIDGVAQPLPLFQPPIDPMALVAAAASKGGIAAAAMAGGMVNVSDYRFDTLMAKAQDLAGKLKNLSDTLLSALEKQDSEELSLLQHTQEEMMLDLVTVLKDQQIQEAENSLQDMETSKLRAQDQLNHYTKLIDAGYLPEERIQIAMMGAAASVYGIAVLSKVVSGLSYVLPQFTAGPFSFGVTSGGQNVGAMLAEFGEAKESLAEGLSMGGEAAGVVGQFKRSTEDWDLQKKMATWEMTQLAHQIDAQICRIAMAKQELLMHKKEIENSKAIAQFMKSKFSNAELYNWMSGKLSGLFFQTFKLAHDYAKQAEQSFIFEKGLQAGKVNYITGMYWDSQRKGLLAGYSLELDLDRMEKAYAETDSRRLEITKNISLLELDPLALLALKTQGACTFRLSEELLDYDFPGHYNRQIKSVSLAFDIGEGQSVNATLTQLSSKLVMDTDIKAVKHLIDPANESTPNVRANWRASQQIALSHVDQYTENSGMFELNFGDERYLPFEGTGAVSTWRLELNGKKGSYNPADLLDVTIKLRYTAKQGGTRFANEVKGVLKPYNATSFFDIAYNFPDEWAALTSGDSDEVNITFTREMFPNMNSSKIIGLLIRYQYDGSNNNGSNSGAIFTINDLSAPNNTYLQPSTLSIGQKGSEWIFTLKGDRTALRNAEMVLVYKANV
ncbi:hemopexin repeat-containing protein [Leptolyngbya sp. ST-U4]|uniref:Tc toxin subunit A-related protein n=2 Tax=unclassified Leptolyngbya TaxID=2650499 RepID=UPI003299C4F7